MSNYSELVLLFDTQDFTDIAGQLSKAFDEHSDAGNMKRMPSMMIVRPEVWSALEKELTVRIKERYGTAPKQYDRVGKEPGIQRPPKQGYNALIFRSRPVVAIDGDNVVSAKVGAI